jgi:hypothetical protein
MKETKFSYTRMDGSETFQDGLVVELTPGIFHITCWGSENHYIVIQSGMQNGTEELLCVDSQCDSPIKLWQDSITVGPNVRGVPPNGSNESTKWLGWQNQMLDKLMFTIGDHMNQISKDSLRVIFKQALNW